LVRDVVSRGVDTVDVGLHRGAELDAVLLELDAPAGDGPEVRLEADERENGVDLEGELLVRAVVEDGDGANAVVAVDLAHLLVREQLDLSGLDGRAQLPHGVGVGSEAFAAVDEDEA